MQHVSTLGVPLTYQSASAKALNLIKSLPAPAVAAYAALLFSTGVVIPGKTTLNLKLVVPQRGAKRRDDWLGDICLFQPCVSFAHVGLVVVPPGLDGDITMMLNDAPATVAEVHDVTVHIGGLAPLLQ